VGWDAALSVTISVSEQAFKLKSPLLSWPGRPFEPSVPQRLLHSDASTQGLAVFLLNRDVALHNFARNLLEKPILWEDWQASAGIIRSFGRLLERNGGEALRGIQLPQNVVAADIPVQCLNKPFGFVEYEVSRGVGKKVLPAVSRWLSDWKLLKNLVGMRYFAKNAHHIPQYDISLNFAAGLGRKQLLKSAGWIQANRLLSG